MSDTHIYMRYHRSPTPELETKILLAPRDPGAYWFDDLQTTMLPE